MKIYDIASLGWNSTLRCMNHPFIHLSMKGEMFTSSIYDEIQFPTAIQFMIIIWLDGSILSCSALARVTKYVSIISDVLWLDSQQTHTHNILISIHISIYTELSNYNCYLIVCEHNCSMTVTSKTRPLNNCLIFRQC